MESFIVCQDMPIEKLLTCEETMEILQLKSKSILYRLISEKKIRRIKVSNIGSTSVRLLFRIQDVYRYKLAPNGKVSSHFSLTFKDVKNLRKAVLILKTKVHEPEILNQLVVLELKYMDLSLVAYSLLALDSDKYALLSKRLFHVGKLISTIKMSIVNKK